MIDQAFILAAGFGTRMQPLTHSVPKPLVELNGKPLLDYIVEHLGKRGVKKVVVNAHYLSHKILEWADSRRALFPDMDIHVIVEDPILDTGGGVCNALSYFNNQPFFVIAGDSFWVEGDSVPSVFSLLEENWDTKKMDMLFIVQNIKSMTLTKGVGDYNLAKNGQIVRKLDRSGSHMFTNIRINHPRIFAGRKIEPFSFLELMDKTEQENRLYGLNNPGQWHHISTPEDLLRVETYLETDKNA